MSHLWKMGPEHKPYEKALNKQKQSTLYSNL